MRTKKNNFIFHPYFANKVRQIKRERPIEYSVLTYLCEHMDKENIFVSSIATMERDIGKHREVIKAAIWGLEEEGFLAAEKKQKKISCFVSPAVAKLAEGSIW